MLAVRVMMQQKGELRMKSGGPKLSDSPVRACLTFSGALGADATRMTGQF